jgi:hypothetical protein
MDMKQFLSWNLTAVPCARLAELTRTGTADLIGLAVGKGKFRANPEASWSDQVYETDCGQALLCLRYALATGWSQAGHSSTNRRRLIRTAGSNAVSVVTKLKH